jgi:DNA modification methylase
LASFPRLNENRVIGKVHARGTAVPGKDFNLLKYTAGERLWVVLRRRGARAAIRPLVSDLHPTTKPVELLARMIANSSLPGEFVYDPFCGSGSTNRLRHPPTIQCEPIPFRLIVTDPPYPR